jgi:hypothetical protein
MKRIALAALAASALFSSAAQADEAFDSFRSFCVSGHGASATALSAADAAGWMPVPQQFLSQLPQGEFQGAQGRMKTTQGGASLLLTARGTMAQIGPVGICAIGVIPANTSDLAAQLQAFAAVPKQAAVTRPISVPSSPAARR